MKKIPLSTYRVFLLVWALIVFILSVIPMPPPVVTFLWWDKLMHASFYLPLGALSYLAWPEGPRRRRLVRATLIGLAFGVALELIQALLPWRSCEFWDAAADLFGSGGGALLGLLFAQFRNRSVAKR